MANPSAIRDAVVAALEASAALMAAFPDGVWFGVAPPGSTKFVIVSLVIAEDEDVMGEVDAGIQTHLYLVKAVEQSPSATNVAAGAALIHELLQKTPLDIDGYCHMVTRRVEHVEYPEVDEDTDERWQHCGGRYEVMVSPGASAENFLAFDIGAFF